MNDYQIRMVQKLFVIAMSALTLGLSESYAQIGELGIWGCPPASYRDHVRRVKIEPNDTDAPIGYTIPVNGHKNFNFLLLQDGSAFLPAGHYTVSYWNADLTTLYGDEIVNYLPNSGHTMGTKVRDFNIPPGYQTTPRGLHGIVYGRIGGVNYIFHDASVNVIGRTLHYVVNLRTNGDGYFSAYYTNGYAGEFLRVNPIIGGYERYDVIITGYLNGCGFSSYLPIDAVWEPLNSVYPDMLTYFTWDAETDVGDLVITPNNCMD